MSEMTSKEKAALEEMPTVGYWSELGGVEVKKIEYGVDDYVLCISNAWYGKHSYHRVRIDYGTDSRSYVRIHSVKLYLDECIRV